MPIAAETTARVVALTCTQPPHQATHWTGRAMAKAMGLSVGSVQRIWRAHRLQPHRLRTFKRSRDPSFAAKLTDMTRQRIRRGVFRSIADLQAAINAYLAEHNASSKPFVWTKSADAISAKLDRLPVTSL